MQFLGLDFGTESCRAVMVDETGSQLATATCTYQNGQIVKGSEKGLKFKDQLSEFVALQHSNDWFESFLQVTQECLKHCDDKRRIDGIGVSFTSCTMLPCSASGEPIYLIDGFSDHIHAFPKLWKHHGAAKQTEKINAVAQKFQSSEFMRHYSLLGEEFLLSKILEIEQCDADVAKETDLYIEAGDWFVWQLIGGEPEDLNRSLCQAGFKGMAATGELPPEKFFTAIGLNLNVRNHKLRGVYRTPGSRAGILCERFVKELNLNAVPTVGVAIIDAHSAVLGCGAIENEIVMSVGTSGCYIFVSEEFKNIDGVAGIVQNSILEGKFAYEFGQGAVGDCFAWAETFFGISCEELEARAATCEPCSLLCTDYLNGCRTPLMNPNVKGCFLGVTLHTQPHHFYRALIEACCFGLRRIVSAIAQKLNIAKFILCGGVVAKSPLFVEILATTLNELLYISEAKHASAQGAAILAAASCGKYASVAAAQKAMGLCQSAVVRPKKELVDRYTTQYNRYLKLCQVCEDMQTS